MILVFKVLGNIDSVLTEFNEQRGLYPFVLTEDNFKKVDGDVYLQINQDEITPSGIYDLGYRFGLVYDRHIELGVNFQNK